MQNKLYTIQFFPHCQMTNGTASPRAAITEPMDFPELTVFAELTDFTKLAKLMENPRPNMGKFELRKRSDSRKRAFLLPASLHL